MKRLLTYLFLVLGLGLVVNINAEAKTKIDLSFCKVSDYNIFAALTDRFYNDCTRNSGNKISYQKFLQSRMKHICFNTRTKNVMSRQLPCVKDLGHSKVFYENGSFYYASTETQIAKKEPTETQQVATSGITFCQKNNADIKKNLTSPVYRVENGSCYSDSRKITFKKYVDILVYWSSWKSPMSYTLAINVAKSIKEDFIKANLDTDYLYLAFLRDFTKVPKNELIAALNIPLEKTTQIAKKEKKKPKQVAESGNLVKDIKELSKLYEEGLLTEEEFTKAKEKLLGTGKKQKVVKKEKKKKKKVVKKEPTQTQQVVKSALPNCKGSYSSKWTNCQGTFTWPTGAKYVGEFLNGEVQGYGTKTWTDGTKYVGYWINGKMQGKGKIRYVSGCHYVGDWVDADWKGEGTYTCHGRVEAGIWDGDKLISKKKTPKKKEKKKTQQVAKKQKDNAKKLNLTYKAYILETAPNSVAILFLDKGKCKSGSKVLSIFKNYNYKGSWKTPCKWRYRGTNNEIVNLDVGEGVSAHTVFIRRGTNNIYGTILGRSELIKITEADQKEVIRLAKRFNNYEFLSLINKNIETKIAKKEPKKKEKKVAKKKEPKQTIKEARVINYGICYKDSEKIYYIKLTNLDKCKTSFSLKRYHVTQLESYRTLKAKGYTEIPKRTITKKEKKVAKKTEQSWKCKLFGLCGPEKKTQQVAKKKTEQVAKKKTEQVAKKIINIYCVKNNYSAVRMEIGEKPNCKNGEFKVVKNEYLLLETVYDSLASYFDLNDPNEVALFDRRVRDIFKTTHQDFNKLTDTQQVAKIESTKKTFNLLDLLKKEKKRITTKEVLDLGKYTEFNAYPEGMLKKFKTCKKQFCRGKIAGKQVYEIFARRGELWHQRHPGDIIHGMAWFEIFYLEKLRKNEKQITRYIKNGPKGYSSKMKMNSDVSSLHGLIKTNKGRIKMREALGLSLNDDLETVLKRHWLLGDFLNKDKLKVKKVKINSDMKKRKKLLAEYKSALTRYKNKLEEERRATN